MSGSRWPDEDVLHVSVSTRSTEDPDVERCLDALRAAALTLAAQERFIRAGAWRESAPTWTK
jgi:hypothetical protein